jgi:alpha-amylase
LNELVTDVEADYPDAAFVGEDWSTGSEYIDYYQSKIQSFFDFERSVDGASKTIVGLAKGFIYGDEFSEAIETTEKTVKASKSNSYSSYFMSNHDQDRVSKNLTGNLAKVGASITYLLPGTPWCYYGEEIGLKGVRNTSPDDRSDVKRRLPMIWSESDKTGQCQFPESGRSDLDDTVQVKKGVSDLLSDPLSLTNHYRKVAEVRNKHPLFKDGVYTAIKTNFKPLYAYKIAKGDESIVVVTNTGGYNRSLDVSSFAASIVDEINTADLKPSLKDGVLSLGAYSTVVLTAK